MPGFGIILAMLLLTAGWVRETLIPNNADDTGGGGATSEDADWVSKAPRYVYIHEGLRLSSRVVVCHEYRAACALISYSGVKNIAIRTAKVE